MRPARSGTRACLCRYYGTPGSEMNASHATPKQPGRSECRSASESCAGSVGAEGRRHRSSSRWQRCRQGHGRGNRGKWRRARRPNLFSSRIALLRVAYERIRPGCNGVYTVPCRASALIAVHYGAASRLSRAKGLSRCTWAWGFFFVRIDSPLQRLQRLRRLHARDAWPPISRC